MLFQISVRCMSNTDVLRASCAECPNPLMPDLFGWCTGGGDCEIQTFRGDLAVDPSLSSGVFSYPALDICVSKYNV